ncbi:MAG: PadR family transcriptional regulator [Solirubrobacterales bacterium]|nr:PadR family transcriptional regulator [Solirubrobacterales bacterium]
MTPLTPTGRVILGMIALGNQTGYDIKRVVDKSTRHFWSASYGQIYPELRRLEEQGLIQGQSEPTGGRARTVYTLTPAGRAALGDWLEPEQDPTFDVRDEGMLRLFFSDFGTTEQRIANLRAMRGSHLRTVAQLEGMSAHAADMHPGPHLTLELGLGLHRWLADWCEAAERRLRQETNDAGDAD